MLTFSNGSSTSFVDNRADKIAAAVGQRLCLGSTAHIIFFASNHLMREFRKRQCAVLLETARRERRNARQEEAEPRVMDEVDHKLPRLHTHRGG